MSTCKLVYTRQAKNNARKAASSGLRSKIEELLEIISEDSFEEYPPCEKLAGILKGAFSRRINIQHRLVYQVYEVEKVVKIIRMWTHFD